jgi:hypothetical protein
MHEFYIPRPEPLPKQFPSAHHHHCEYCSDISYRHPRCIIFEGWWVIGTFMNYIVKELLVVINRIHFDSYPNKICNVYNILQYSIIFYNKYMKLYRNKITSHIISYYSLQFFTFFYTILQFSTIFYNILKISIIFYNFLLFPIFFTFFYNILHYSTIVYHFLPFSKNFYNFLPHLQKF